MKRIIRTITILSAILTLFLINSISVSASEDKTFNKFKYYIEGNGITISGYTGDESYVYIPDSIERRYVTVIKDGAFNDKNKIEYIRLPAHLERIESKAFYGCSSLKTLVLPNSLLKFEIYGEFPNLETLVFGNNIYRLSGPDVEDALLNSKIKYLSVSGMTVGDIKNYTVGADSEFSPSDVYYRGLSYSGNKYYMKNVNYHFTDKEMADIFKNTSMRYVYESISKNHYKVTFNANGGKIPVIYANNNTSSSVLGYLNNTFIYTLKGQQVSEEICPEKSDCEFDGWYDNPECRGEAWDFARDKVTKNMTLYAKWVPFGYRITFDADGGKCDTISKKYPFGLALESLPTPTKSGYTFAGWYTRRGCEGDKFTEATLMRKADMTLYAGWIRNGKKLTVTLDASGGKCSKKSFKTKFGQKLSSLPTPTYTGKKFVEWNTQKNGKGTSYTSASLMDMPELKLYAIWEIGKYKLTLDTNGGTLSKTSALYAYNETIGNIKTPRRDNYTFMGWFYKNGTRFKATDKMPEKDITLTAKWSGFEYMIFLDAGKGKVDTGSISVNCGENIGALPKPVRSGYLFMGWYDENGTLYTEKTEMPDRDITLSANWKKVSEYAQKIITEEKNITLGEGMKYKIITTTEPEYTLDEFKWSSSDTDIAVVDINGLVTARSKGNAEITVFGKNVSASIKITVLPMTKKLVPSYTSRNLNIGQKVEVRVTYSGYAGSLKYKSSNSKVVLVNESGTVTAVGKGTAIITVTAQNGVKTEITITVK